MGPLRGQAVGFQRILVPVDGSQTSDKALATALALARESGARVRLMHVMAELPMSSYLGQADDPLGLAREQAQQLLERAFAGLRSAHVEGDMHLLSTPGLHLGHAVAQEASAWQADLVVVGTHGRRGLWRMLLGSGAASVIRHCRAPILLVPGSAD